MCGGASVGSHLLRKFPLAHPAFDPYRGYLEKSAAPDAQGLRAHFLGTSSVLLTDGQTSVLSDGFVTRPNIWSVRFGKVAPDRARIRDAIDRLGARSLAAVFCAHSHYDHAMDAPVWAIETGADLVGSPSTANIGRGLGVSESSIKLVADGQTLTYGAFDLTFIDSVHSPGDHFPGVVTEPLTPPARAGAWKTDACYSVVVNHPEGRVLIHASANYRPGALHGQQVDTIYFGIGALGRQSEKFANDYWNEVVRATGARKLILVHWDDFFTPLDRPLRPMPYVLDDFEASMRRLVPLAKRDNIEMVLPSPWQPTSPLAAYAGEPDN